MFVASQSTRRWIDSRAASSSAATLPVRPGSIVSIVASASVTPAPSIRGARLLLNCGGRGTVRGLPRGGRAARSAQGHRGEAGAGVSRQATPGRHGAAERRGATVMRLSRPALLAPFAMGGFPGLWISASSGSFARVITQLAFSWITLEATGSPFLVGVVAATRMVPQLLLGIPAGALADWVDRRLMVMLVNGASVVVLLLSIPLVHFGLLTPPVIVGMAALYGVLDTMRAASTQSYAYDLVRTTRATSGMALMNLGVQLLGTVGGLVGGYTLEQFGAATTFGLVACAMLVAALAPALGHR